MIKVGERKRHASHAACKPICAGFSRWVASRVAQLNYPISVVHCKLPMAHSRSSTLMRFEGDASDE